MYMYTQPGSSYDPATIRSLAFFRGENVDLEVEERRVGRSVLQSPSAPLEEAKIAQAKRLAAMRGRCIDTIVVETSEFL